MGWSVGRGVPSPLKKGSGEGAQLPPQKFLNFFGSMCSKNFCVQAKGGASPSATPLNTPLLSSIYAGISALRQGRNYGGVLGV